jgi:hypothetical protein
MRASYQDSNIFGYKDGDNSTVQKVSQNQNEQRRVRYNPTFDSKVFGQVPETDETERPPSASRQEENWASTVFEGPTPHHATRKKLGGACHGTENLFGEHKVDFDNRSNKMAVLGVKSVQEKKWKPVRQDKTAEQRKHDELHGASAKRHGVNKKNDGTLSCAVTDWKNPQHTLSNSPVKQARGGGGGFGGGDTSKDRKY